MDPIIDAKNLNFTYNKGRDNEYQALIDVSIRIYPEEFIIFYGPSGCGKSTLLNVIAGLEQPDNGSIYVLGRNLIKMTKKEFAMYHRTEVGMIYQQYNLITSLSVLDNVALPQLFINTSRRKRNQLSFQLLKRFGIEKQAKKIPTELSGGQQQRIGIARSIVNDPHIILADEPVGNLDSVSAENVLEILKDLNKKEKKTIVLVTHNPEHLDYGDRIFYLKDGLIVNEVNNRTKKKKQKDEEKTVKSPTAELMNMMRSYQGLTPEQINILIMPYKSKVFAHHFVSSKNMEETKILEDLLQRRMLGTVSRGELYEVLNKPSNEGGVGFDVRTADKLMLKVDQLIKIAYFIYQKRRQAKNEQGQHDVITDDEKAEKVMSYLLNSCYDKYYKNLDEIQISRLRQAIKDRITAKIQKSEFYNYLDMPFRDSGVGLNSKTASAITDEMELMLVVGYGVAQKNKEVPVENKESENVQVENQMTINSSNLLEKEAVKDREEVENIENKEKINKEIEEDIELRERFKYIKEKIESGNEKIERLKKELNQNNK